MEPVIKASDLGKTYSDGTQGLRDASVEIHRGEFVAIMGPSGSGKSTLLHILGLLDRQTHGTYRFAGHQVDSYSEDEIARLRNKEMGFVFQFFNLLPRMSVVENVKLPLLYSGRKEKEWDALARKAVDAVDMSHRVDHDASRLSGGEKQRTAIARALVNDPRVIFADEPTGNLDSKSGETVMNILRSLHEQGHTVILVTHDSHDASYAKRTIHLRDGAIESDKAHRS